MSCYHANPTGIVTNQPEKYDKDRAHAATTVCAREKCKKAAAQWVLKKTGEPGVYRDFTRSPLSDGSVMG